MERSSVSPRGNPGTSLRLFATALIIIVADQVVKGVVASVLRLGQSVDVFGTFFRMTRTENTGAAFGLFQGGGVWFIIISALASIAIIVFSREIARARRFEQIAFGLVLGGAVGNLIDRVRLGAVIDFLDFGVGRHRFPAFNVADSAITIGVTLIAVSFLFFKRPGTADAGSPDAVGAPSSGGGAGPAGGPQRGADNEPERDDG